MIGKSASRWSSFFEMDALKSAPFLTNGQCVQKVMEAGEAKGRPSNATANSEFLGIGFGVYKGRPATYPKVENVKVGADEGATARGLLKRPVSNTSDLYVYAGGDYSGILLTKITTGDPASGEVKLDADGRTLIVNENLADSTLFVVYNYVPTPSDFNFEIQDGGDVYPGNQAQQYFGKITVITDGIVATDQFDKAVNWSTVKEGDIKGGANGIFTTSGNGCVCKGVRVKSVPTEDQPYLVLTIGNAV